jgi:hypothetical protein
MITLDKIPDEFRTDHLLLLIGANPLPNYVAAHLLTTPTSKVHLLHSAATSNVAKALRGLLQKHHPKLEFAFWQIDSANGAQIRKQVQAIVGEFERTESVGLHYTGGTKAMSVHAYRKLSEKRPDALFSYLEAQTLSLRVEHADDSLTREIQVQHGCHVTLEELMSLHGYGLQNPLRTEAKHTAITTLLAELCADSTTYKPWRRWLEQAFGRDKEIDQALYALCESTINPELNALAALLKEHIGGDITLEAIARLLEAKDFAATATWFNGKWLEEYTLLHLGQIAQDLRIESYTISLKAKKGLEKKRFREFELDLAAMRGYQLFAFSCRASDLKEQCKEHLLEVVIRAKQLGGDEAKAGLVCFVDRPEALEDEINETWFQDERKKQVRVFGRKHLLTLDSHLRDWFASANLA